jgi:hypothetical protein
MRYSVIVPWDEGDAQRFDGAGKGFLFKLFDKGKNVL